MGIYALAAAAIRTDVQIYAFEPNPHAYARLRVNKFRNGFANIVESNIAVGHERGVVDFSWFTRASGQIASGGSIGAFPERSDLERTVVRMEPLDKILGVRDLGERGLVKIDVEGAEMAVFEGMKETLKKHRPDIIVETFNQQHVDFINERILPLGYRVWTVDETTGLHATDGIQLQAREKEGNYLLSVRDAPVV